MLPCARWNAAPHPTAIVVCADRDDERFRLRSLPVKEAAAPLRAEATLFGVATALNRSIGCLAITAIRALTRSRSEEHTSELQSLMRISYAVFCLKKKKQRQTQLHQYNRAYAN